MFSNLIWKNCTGYEYDVGDRRELLWATIGHYLPLPDNSNFRVQYWNYNSDRNIVRNALFTLKLCTKTFLLIMKYKVFKPG